MDKGDVFFDPKYFNCARMHAKIPKATCLSRQFALVQGSRRFLFPECGKCSQGKVIAKENQNMLREDKEKPVVPDETKGGNSIGDGELRLCTDCGKKPTISPRSPYCSSCMQKRAIEARKNKQKPKNKDGRERKISRQSSSLREISKSVKTVGQGVLIEFGEHSSILEGIKCLAKEEFRSLEMQIIWMLREALQVDVSKGKT